MLAFLVTSECYSQRISNISHFDNADISQGQLIKSITLVGQSIHLKTKTDEFIFDGSRSYKITSKAQEFKNEKLPNYKGPIFLNDGSVLFYGQQSGIKIYDEKFNLIRTHAPSIDSCSIGLNKVIDIKEDVNGNLWINSYRNGLYFWDLDHDCVRHIQPQSAKTNLFIHEIRRFFFHKCDSTKLFLAHPSGIETIDVTNFEVEHVASIEKFEPLDHIFQSCNSLLIGTWFEGAIEINLSTGKTTMPAYSTFKKSVLDKQNQVSDLFINDEYTLVSFLTQGCYMLNVDTLSPLINLNQPEYSKFNRISQVILDDYNNLWILHNGKLSKGFLTYLSPQTVNHKGAKFILKTENSIISGGSSNSVNIYNHQLEPTEQHTIEQAGGLSNGKNLLFATSSDKDEVLFAGYNSLYELDNQRKKVLPYKSDIYDKASDDTETRNLTVYKNQIIVPTKRGGLFLINLETNKSTKLVLRNSTKSPKWHFYRDLINQGDSILWLTSENGLAKFYNKDKIEYYGINSIENNGELIGLIDRISVDPSGKLWCVNSQGEIFRFHNDKFFKAKSSFQPSTVRSVTHTSDGVLWILTKDFLYSYDASSDLITFFNGNSAIETSSQKKISTINGSLVLTGKNGHTFLDTTDLNQITNEYNFDFHSIKVDGIEKNLNVNNKIVVPSNKQSLEILCLILGNSTQKDLRLSYQLNDEAISDAQNNEIRLSNLQLGLYNLNICLVHTALPNNKSCKTIILDVLGPWYLDPKYLLLLTAIIVSLIYLIIRWQVNRAKKKAQEEIQQIQAKERETSIFNKKIAELEMQSLQSQMNPHFIFNSINSLKLMILNKDAQKGADYLQKFSNMVRKILQNSRNKLITLEDEIDLLQMYTDFEKLRFGKDVAINISIDPDIDPSFVTVPPMLIQPFVENAIWHGLLHIEDKDPLLDIKLLAEDSNLICEISDNGIGRKASSELRRNITHNSLGGKITEERLEVYKKLFGKSISIVYIDHDQKTKTGTTVIITFEDHL